VGSARSARLATLNPSGVIDLVPITFALLDDDTLVTAVDHKPKTTRRLQRLVDIEADPRVTLLVDHYDDDWSALWWVRVRGTASVVSDGDPFERAMGALVARYTQYTDRLPAGPIIVVELTAWLGWAADLDVAI
jgi:PPOX class probable F420-dependent enzyme